MKDDTFSVPVERLNIGKRQATLAINDERGITRVLIGCHVEWDYAFNMWRATDDLGNVAHDEMQDGAVLRCLGLRLGVVLARAP